MAEAQMQPAKQDDYTRAEAEFGKLLRIMDRLRSPGGCPWDGEQTHASLMRYLIEESYEVVEAVEASAGIDHQLLQEELGDVLLQVVFHSRIAEESLSSREGDGFSIVEVLRGLNEKLERRHPHVFASEAVNLGEIVTRWEELKKQEKPERTSPFDGIPPHLPALALAEKTMSKANKGAVELPNLGSEAECESEEELGQLLFGIVQAANARGLDPERALRTFTRNLIEQETKRALP